MLNELRYVDRWEDGDFKREVEAERLELMKSPAICHYALYSNPGIQVIRSQGSQRGWVDYGEVDGLGRAATCLLVWVTWILRHFCAPLRTQSTRERPDPLVQC